MALGKSILLSLIIILGTAVLRIQGDFEGWRLFFHLPKATDDAKNYQNQTLEREYENGETHLSDETEIFANFLLRVYYKTLLAFLTVVQLSIPSEMKFG